MTGFQTPPERRWRSWGNDPLPTPAEARAEPFSAVPSWFLRIECDRCGKVVMVNEAHAPWRILTRMRHDGWGAGCQGGTAEGDQGHSQPQRGANRAALGLTA